VTVGFYSPLPPARTGVADYSAALLAALRQIGRVEVSPERCDVPLYHLGNNELHAEIYRRALEHPGVIVLHDAVLHHFLLGQLDRQAYVEEFTFNYGEWNRGTAEELWQARAASGADHRYFQFPMLKRVAECSRAVIVHNPAAARMVREHAPGACVIEIPFLFEKPSLPAADEVARYRGGVGLPPDGFLFGVFGYLRESKRLGTVLETFARLHAVEAHTSLLVAGSFVSTDLEQAVEPFLAAPGVVRVPHLSKRDFWLAASAVDACINLRYPTAGETSAIAIQFMGIGKPVLLTEAEECSRLPEDSCVRIAPGTEEADSLWNHMVLLRSVPEVARAIGRRGAEHIREHHQIERIAQLYWDTLCAHSG
jgi:glycosyltransferase involved in cell wall biosynthesis